MAYYFYQLLYINGIIQWIIKFLVCLISKFLLFIQIFPTTLYSSSYSYYSSRKLSPSLQIIIIYPYSKFPLFHFSKNFQSYTIFQLNTILYMLTIYTFNGQKIITFDKQVIPQSLTFLYQQISTLRPILNYKLYQLTNKHQINQITLQSLVQAQFLLLLTQQQSNITIFSFKFYARKGDSKGIVLRHHHYTTFQNIFIQISRRLKIQINDIQMYYQGKNIIDLSQTLKQKSFNQFQVLHIIDKKTIPQDLEQIFPVKIIKSKGDTQIKQLRLYGNQTILELKKLINEKYDIPIQKILIAYRGILLKNSLTINQSRIGIGSLISILDSRQAVNKKKAELLRLEHVKKYLYQQNNKIIQKKQEFKIEKIIKYQQKKIEQGSIYRYKRIQSEQLQIETQIEAVKENLQQITERISSKIFSKEQGIQNQINKELNDKINQQRVNSSNIQQKQQNNQHPTQNHQTNHQYPNIIQDTQNPNQLQSLKIQSHQIDPSFIIKPQTQKIASSIQLKQQDFNYYQNHQIPKSFHQQNLLESSNRIQNKSQPSQITPVNNHQYLANIDSLQFLDKSQQNLLVVNQSDLNKFINVQNNQKFLDSQNKQDSNSKVQQQLQNSDSLLLLQNSKNQQNNLKVDNNSENILKKIQYAQIYGLVLPSKIIQVSQQQLLDNLLEKSKSQQKKQQNLLDGINQSIQKNKLKQIQNQFYSSIQIIIKDLNFNQYTVIASQMDFVQKIKQKLVANYPNLSLKKLAFLHNGRKLNNNEIIKSIGVESGLSLFMMQDQ